MSEYRELLLGCGHQRRKDLCFDGSEWRNLTTLDFNPDCRPDVEWDLSRRLPLPFEDNTFDEIHAYEVLEHIGQQGDFVRFFEQFSDYWRVLKPDGHFFATVPNLASPWLWADPGHTRTISIGTLTFLDQSEYDKQLGVTQLTDYRRWYRADFDIKFANDQEAWFGFVMRAIKPSRIKRA